MDGRGHWLDNVFVERLWRSLKYEEEMHLKTYPNALEARSGIGQWIRCYNTERLHQALGYQTPAAVWAAEVSSEWICCYPWTTPTRRPQLHRANGRKRDFHMRREEERL